MTLQNAKVTLFASLIAAMILSFAAMDFVAAEKNTLRSEMKSIHDQMKTADNVEKKQLQTIYIAKNQDLNEMIHMPPARDFVKEWKVLDLQGMDLIEQQFDAKMELKSLPESEKGTKQAEITQRDLKIVEIRTQIDALQAEVLEFMEMDPADENRFSKIISELHQAYDGTDTAFVMAGINYEQKKMVVELTADFDDAVGFENSSVAIAEKIRDVVGDGDVLITVDSMRLTSCTHYKQECRPLVGGIAIARADDPSEMAGSIGYKAIKGSDTGYVTAGHVVDYYNTGNRAMIQPLDGEQISDGTGHPFTKNRASGDVSFQKTSVDINDEIYYSSNTRIDIVTHATASSEHEGQFVYKMGAGGGLSWGYVQNHWTTIDVWETSAGTTGGDSGGSVFNVSGYANGQYNGKLFGHVYGATNEWKAIYQPAEKITANHGIYPATT